MDQRGLADLRHRSGDRVAHHHRVDDAGDADAARGIGAARSRLVRALPGQRRRRPAGLDPARRHVVQLNAAGALHSGKYLVWSVRHHITAEKHAMEFVLVRNAVGTPRARGLLPGGFGL